MAPFEHDHHADDEQTILSMEDQGEVARFLAEFGDDLVLDAAAMQQDLHSLMRDVRIQLVEHMVRTGEIEPDAADVTLQSIDAALEFDKEFTYDSIRRLLDTARTEHPGDVGLVQPDWTLAEYLHERQRANMPDEDMTDAELDQLCYDADMFGVFDMEPPEQRDSGPNIISAEEVEKERRRRGISGHEKDSGDNREIA